MECQHFKTCSANLCPIDPGLEERTWFVGEPVCRRKDYATMPMIRRQRQLNKRKPKEYTGKSLRPHELRETAPKERSLSDEHRARLAEGMERVRQNVGQKSAV